MKLSVGLMHVRRIVCGISGGVDSAVSALLLKRKGFDVVGLFMKNWDIRDEKGTCTTDDDRKDAEFVCKTLHIPFYEVDFVKQYWNEVFSNMVKDYENGITPNPDILCNRHIKFNHFIHHAKTKLGAHAIATGHYASTSVGYNLDQIDPQVGVSLLCAADTEKDQTFFLSQITQWALQKTIFPLGDLTKAEVKKLAAESGMEKIAKKKESMGICFIGSRNFHSFIEQYIEPRAGNFIDVDTGKVVGEHKGTHYWTLGQRCLLAGLSAAYFVCNIHPEDNEVIVASGTDHPALFTSSFITEGCHWINGAPPSNTFDARFRFQHRHRLINCTGHQEWHGGYNVLLDQPMRAVTPGQFAVFYKDNICLGSGRIWKLGPTLHEQGLKEKVSFPKDLS
uniref:tRNA-5-taurinomethyluridine 2-sulfurtransferase n=1 Tax=Arion vulgaris TaxID=1028688 RepID=A0A0B6XZM7_9EUPU